MRNLVLLVHTSLDGFVAGVNGELTDFDVSDENLAFVTRLTEEADAALVGRKSYQLLEAFWPNAKDRANATVAEIAFSNWYNDVTKIIFSNTIEQNDLKNTIIINKNISNEITGIKEKEGKDILIFGSPSVSQLLMELDLIDSYWIFINPIIFGKGIPLFTKLPNKSKLKIMSTKQLGNGELAINYVVER